METIPELLDILEVIYNLYLQRNEENLNSKTLFSLYQSEIGEPLRAKGFEISDYLSWQRLYEYNKTIAIKRKEKDGTETTTYWLCIEDIHRFDTEKENSKDKTMPLLFQMGTVCNEIATLKRKRRLEEEQLRFWKLYKWAAVATIALTILTSICAVCSTFIFRK